LKSSCELAAAGRRRCVANAFEGMALGQDQNSFSLCKKQKGKKMIKALWNDEAGVILSAELVLIGTILVVGMIVGLVELQCSVVGELNDLGDAIGSLNQSYVYSSVASYKQDGSIKGATYGSVFVDVVDECDNNQCQIVCAARPLPEAPKGF